MIKKLASTLSILLLSSSISQANPLDDISPMKFELMPSGVVRATGLVTADTYTLLKRFDRKYGLARRTVVLNSRGGYTNTAISIGHFFRKKKVTTMLGKIDIDGAIRDGAVCQSICPIVFLGGYRRLIPDGSTFGVHQLWIPNFNNTPDGWKYSGDDVYRLQYHIGKITSYVVEMGGSAKFMGVMLATPPEKITTVSIDDMKKFNWFTK